MAVPSLSELEAHPAANAYRLMTEDELADLAADIAENGLLDPITIGVLNGERFIVDGRNRLKACDLAGVAPEFEEIEFDDAETLSAFVASRNERRNITVSQKAMAYTLLFPEPAKGGRGKLSHESESLGISKAYWQNLLSFARAVLAYSPELASEVRDGTRSLKEAFETGPKAARERRDQLQRLELEAPDLAAQVKEETLSLSVAMLTHEIRLRERRLVQDVVEIGRHLIEVKERIAAHGGGGWLPWLKQAFGRTVDDETAQWFMSFAESGKTELTDLDSDHLFRWVLGVPAPEVQAGDPPRPN
jgi:hypothetical protein